MDTPKSPRVEGEVARLHELTLSTLKQLVLNRRAELEEICRETHLIPEDTTMKRITAAMESGATNAACVLEVASVLRQIEVDISKVKEEALSRKELLEKVEKWLAACIEECWLEDYSRDENRYNAGRGAHFTVKCADKARALVNKLPAMVETLASETVSWEKERGVEFTFDGIRLLSMLEEYLILRQEKEQDDGFAACSAGRRGSDVAGTAAKNTLGAATTLIRDVVSLPIEKQTSIDEIIVRFKAFSRKYHMLQRGEYHGTKFAVVREYLRIFNSGSKEELTGLKGVGEKRAVEIIAKREQYPQPFQKLEDLEEFQISTKQFKKVLGIK